MSVLAGVLLLMATVLSVKRRYRLLDGQKRAFEIKKLQKKFDVLVPEEHM